MCGQVAGQLNFLAVLQKQLHSIYAKTLFLRMQCIEYVLLMKL